MYNYNKGRKSPALIKKGKDKWIQNIVRKDQLEVTFMFLDCFDEKKML